MTPQQNNFVNTYAASLACGIYTVLSSMYAVREWSIDFVEQFHINNARNWMAAVCHEINETVSWNGASVASVTSNGVDGQLPPALNVRKST